MKASFSILFWIKRSRLKNGKAPLFVRVTTGYKRIELSAGREASILEWDPKAQAVTTKNEVAKEINNHLALMKAKLLGCQSKPAA